MKYYRVLETENTLDLCPDLIGDIYQKLSHNDYIELDTWDSRLLFAADEVEEVVL